MSEYIRREDALRWCHEDEWRTPDERWRPESEYGEYIKALPTIDADLSFYSDKLWKSAFESGKAWRGKGGWIAYYDEDCPQDGIFKCSICGQIISVETPIPLNFCPNCGADMRGE